MKEVLIISYYFPPLGMGGVQRPLKWAKYLPNFGWKSRVITVKNIVYYARDYSLLKEIEEVPIYRTESLDPLRVAKWFKRNKKSADFKSNSERGGRLFRKFLNYWFIPDIRILWIPFVIVAAAKIIAKNRQIEAVITTSPPNSTHIAGYWIRKIFRIGWVADLRDDWAYEIEKRSPTALHRRINKIVYRTVMKKADRIITVSDRIAENHKEMIRHDNGNIAVIRNGFDPNDFKKAKPVVEDKFTVVYTGSLTPYTSPDTFLWGMQIACKKNPSLKKDALIKFIGTVIDVDLNSMVEAFDLTENVKIYGYMNHIESINILSGADVALLLISKNLGRGMVTGKVYEYIGLRKHIFALISDCDANDLLSTYGNATIVSYDKADNVAEGILKLYANWKKQGDLSIRNTIVGDDLNRIQQVRSIAEILNDLQ